MQRREIPARARLKGDTRWATRPSGGKVGTASDCSIELDREGAVSGLNPGARLQPALQELFKAM